MRAPILRLRHLLLVALMLGASSVAAVAQSVELRLGSTDAYVGEPLRAVIEVSDVEDFEGPFVPTVDGLEIRRLANEQTSTRVEIVNGRVRQEKTVAISFEIVPRRAGDFVIPEFRVESGGRSYLTKPTAIRAQVSETGDLLRAYVRVNPTPLYVGQKGTLDLEIAIRRYRDERLGIVLDERSLWSLVDAQNSEWGAFFPALQKLASEGRRPRGEIREIGGVECVVFVISRPFDPISAGPPPVGEVRIRMEYPTALRRGSDFLFEERLTLAGSRPISVVPEPAGDAVLSPPEDGRPATWNGAVGRFEVRATARPAEAAVGEPITVSLRVTDLSGSAGLEGLVAPDLGSQPGFAERFRVPRDAASGTLEGRAKVFTQSIRALNDRVTEIPPIAFSFFDPVEGVYQTVRTEPIPISVKPSAIARAERPAGTERGPADAAPTAAAAPAKVVGGLLANASPDECAAVGTANWSLLALTATPPLVLLGVAAVATRLRRPADRRLERRARARAEFEAAIAAATTSPASMEQSLVRYVGARLGATGDGLTRRDALDLLRRAGVEPTLVDESDRMLRRCERARYLAGDRGGGSDADVDAEEVRALVSRLEQATSGVAFDRPEEDVR